MSVRSRINKWREERVRKKTDLNLFKKKLGERVPEVVEKTEKEINNLNDEIKEIKSSLESSRRKGVNRQGLIPLLKEKEEKLKRLNNVLKRAKKVKKFSKSRFKKEVRL